MRKKSNVRVVSELGSKTVFLLAAIFQVVFYISLELPSSPRPRGKFDVMIWMDGGDFCREMARTKERRIFLHAGCDGFRIGQGPS